LFANIYITASCTISNAVVYKNGEAVFENKSVSLSNFLISVYNHFGIKYPKFYKMDNLSKLGWLATELLLKDSLSADEYDPKTIGVVLTNASSSLDTDLKYYETTKKIASPALFVYTLPNIVIGEICIRHQIKGENAFFIFDEFNAEFIEQYVGNLINYNILQSCICGWVELLGEQYKTVLFLVEKDGDGQNYLFTKENLNKTYRFENE